MELVLDYVLWRLLSSCAVHIVFASLALCFSCIHESTLSLRVTSRLYIIYFRFYLFMHVGFFLFLSLSFPRPLHTPYYRFNYNAHLTRGEAAYLLLVLMRNLDSSVLVCKWRLVLFDLYTRILSIIIALEFATIIATCAFMLFLLILISFAAPLCVTLCLVFHTWVTCCTRLLFDSTYYDCLHFGVPLCCACYFATLYSYTHSWFLTVLCVCNWANVGECKLNCYFRRPWAVVSPTIDGAGKLYCNMRWRLASFCECMKR